MISTMAFAQKVTKLHVKISLDLQFNISIYTFKYNQLLKQLLFSK